MSYQVNHCHQLNLNIRQQLLGRGRAIQVRCSSATTQQVQDAEKRAAAVKELEAHKEMVKGKLDDKNDALASEVKEANKAAAGPKDLEEIYQENYYQFLEDNASQLVIVDFYTEWCGPCKLMLPKLVDLQEQTEGLRVVKFNCNKRNKELGSKLGIRVVPTYLFYKNNEKIGEVSGAHLDKIEAIVQENV